MPTPTYDLIASNVLSSSASSVTFSSLNTIAAGYRDLVIIIEAKNVGNSLRIRYNSDTASNYSQVEMNGDGSAAASSSQTSNGFYVSPVMDSTNATLYAISIFDFATTDKHKSGLIRGNRAGSLVAATATRWASTSAITSIEFAAGSAIDSGTFYLYGIVS